MAKTKFEYRALNKHNKVHKDWKSCTIKEREKIEMQFPKKFEFRENKPPEPTPSMVEKDKIVE